MDGDHQSGHFLDLVVRHLVLFFKIISTLNVGLEITTRIARVAYCQLSQPGAPVVQLLVMTGH